RDQYIERCVCSSLDMIQALGSSVCSLQSRVVLKFEHGTSKDVIMDLHMSGKSTTHLVVVIGCREFITRASKGIFVS
ncbi:hypothetical protein MKX01_038390, partial [Papaver californicum]